MIIITMIIIVIIMIIIIRIIVRTPSPNGRSSKALLGDVRFMTAQSDLSPRALAGAPRGRSPDSWRVLDTKRTWRVRS